MRFSRADEAPAAAIGPRWTFLLLSPALCPHVGWGLGTVCSWEGCGCRAPEGIKMFISHISGAVYVFTFDYILMYLCSGIW